MLFLQINFDIFFLLISDSFTQAYLSSLGYPIKGKPALEASKNAFFFNS